MSVEKKFGLLSHHGKLVSAQPDGRVEVNREKLDIWEIIEFHKQQDGTFCMKSYHGKWLCAKPDGTFEWNRDWTKEWEKFTIVNNNGEVAIKTHHEKWISAQPDGTLKCTSNQKSWEKFRLVPVNYDF